MSFYLGIDGGGTKTTALVGDEKGNIICKAVSGSLNYNDVGFEGARKTLSDIMEQLTNQLGSIELESAFIGCSALEGEAQPHIIEKLCKGIVSAKAIGMNSDLYVALYSVADKAPRCVAVCGTGSMAVGTADNKSVLTAGGWGHIVGDEGSAYSISRNAIATAFKLYDSDDRSSALVKAVCDFYKVRNLPDAVEIIYSENTCKSDIASFSPVVYDLAKSGNKEAKAILSEQSEEFAATVKTLIKRMCSCETLYLYGGVFANNSIFKELFCESVGKAYPDIVIKSLDTPAEQGALNIARCFYG